MRRSSGRISKRACTWRQWRARFWIQAQVWDMSQLLWHMLAPVIGAERSRPTEGKILPLRWNLTDHLASCESHVRQINSCRCYSSQSWGGLIALSLAIILLSIHLQLATDSMNMFMCECIRGLCVRQSCSGDSTLMCFLDCILWQITLLCDLGHMGWSVWVSSCFAQGATRLPLVWTRSYRPSGSKIQPP